MNFQFYIEKLQASDVFKSFIKENPEAYFCSGFFTMDKEGSDNQSHIDFYVPKEKKIFSFKLDSWKDIEILPMEMTAQKTPDKLPLNTDFDFEVVENLVLKEMENQQIGSKMQKILISLQNHKRKPILICTVFISKLGLLKVHIDPKKNKVILFEKKSLFDLMRKAK